MGTRNGRREGIAGPAEERGGGDEVAGVRGTRPQAVAISASGSHVAALHKGVLRIWTHPAIQKQVDPQVPCAGRGPHLIATLQPERRLP